MATIALHTEQENTRNLQEAQVLSTANTFIPCGLAISSCRMTSISAIAAAAFDESCKWPKKRHFIEADIQPHFCNRQYFGVQKAKNGDRGTIVYRLRFGLRRPRRVGGGSWPRGGKKRKTRPDIARRKERQRDWESCNRTRKRRILRSDTHWPSRRVVEILVRARDGPRPPA